MRNPTLVFWNQVPKASQQTTKIVFSKKTLRPSDVNHETFLGQDLSGLLSKDEIGLAIYGRICLYYRLHFSRRICRYVRNTAKAGGELLHNRVKRVVCYLFLDLPLLVVAWKRRKTFVDRRLPCAFENPVSYSSFVGNGVVLSGHPPSPLHGASRNTRQY